MAGKCGASCNETHEILAKTFIHNIPGNAGFSFGDNFARMKFYFGQFNTILSIRIKSYRISSTPILSHPPCVLHVRGNFCRTCYTITDTEPSCYLTCSHREM